MFRRTRWNVVALFTADVLGSHVPWFLYAVFTVLLAFANGNIAAIVPTKLGFS